MSNLKLIPELRFPEFKNDGEWEEKELGQISEIVRGGSPRPIQDFLTTNSDGLNWLKIADVPSDSKYITGTKEKVIKEALSSTREVNPGDLILSNSMSFGRPYILKITTCIHDGWIAIRKISNATFEDYLYYLISSESSQTYFNTNAAGAAVKNLNADIIKLLPVHFPKNKKEQKKIASCLSSLDDLIAAHSQKLELLKDHKKGLMQNLFPSPEPAEGHKTNLPMYRFKEFEKDGEWVEKKLGEVAENIMYGMNAAATDFDGENIYLRITDIDENTRLISRNSLTSPNGSLEDKYLLKAGDLVFARTGASVGKSYLHQNDTGKVYFAGFLIRFSITENIPYFIYSQTLTEQYQKWVSKTSMRSGQPGINAEEYKLFEFFIPPTIQEQQKIASCLSSLDALITAQAEKIEQLKLHKKGLMQGLFPKMND